MKKEKIFALCRMGVALVIAVVLLAVTGFGFVPMLTDPVEVTDGTQLADSSYVSCDLSYVMTVCGEEVKENGDVVAYYAIAPIGNRFVVLRFPAELHSDVLSMTDATLAYLGGESSVMKIHMPVEGMVSQGSVAVYSLLSQWFESNKEWMSNAGVVGASPLAEDYLVSEVIEVDRLGALSGEYTVALSVLALLLVVYAVVELCFMGKKKDAPAKKEKKEKPAKAEKKEEVKAEPVTEAASEEELPAEEAFEEAVEEAAEETEEAEEEAEEAEEAEAEEVEEEPADEAEAEEIGEEEKEEDA